MILIVFLFQISPEALQVVHKVSWFIFISPLPPPPPSYWCYSNIIKVFLMVVVLLKKFKKRKKICETKYSRQDVLGSVAHATSLSLSLQIYRHLLSLLENAKNYVGKFVVVFSCSFMPLCSGYKYAYKFSSFKSALIQSLHWNGLTVLLSRHSVRTYLETSSQATCQGTFGPSCLGLLSHCGLTLASRVELVCTS